MEQAPAENTAQPTPAPEATAPAPAPENGAKAGAAYGTILGIILIVVILVVGAFYVWGERLEQEQPMLPEESMQDRSGGAADVNVDASLQ